MEQFMKDYLEAGTVSVSNLLLHHYHEIGMTTSELLVVLELQSYIDRGIKNPSLSQIAHNLGAKLDQIYDLIQQLDSDQLVVQQLVKNAEGKEETNYSFAPLWQKMSRWSNEHYQKGQQDHQENRREQLFKEIQSNLGRTISPMEISQVNAWLDEDHYDPKVIEMALKETVMSGSRNFRYMDRVLANWADKHLTTPEAIQAEQARFSAHLQPNRSNQENDGSQQLDQPIPIFKLKAQKGKE